jgi:hypothetical protein
MDKSVETILRAVEGLDAPSVADRVAALRALKLELPHLSELSSDEWDEKLAQIEDDIEDLGDAADRAVARFEQARRAFETLKRFAADEGVVLRSDAQLALVPTSDGTGRQPDGRHDNPIAQAETTREAILQAMARRPHREWTPTAIADDLMRYGRPVERSNVQVTMRRLAADRHIRKVGRGTYQIVTDALDHAEEKREKGPQRSKAEEEAYRAKRHEAALKAAETKRRKKLEAEKG